MVTTTVRSKSFVKTDGSRLLTEDMFLVEHGDNKHVERMWKAARGGKYSHITPAQTDKGEKAVLMCKPLDVSKVDSLTKPREVRGKVQKVTSAQADEMLSSRQGPSVKKSMVKQFSDWFLMLDLDSDFEDGS